MDAGTIIMALITFASVIVAIYSVWDGRKRYIDSIQPIISFKLTYYDVYLNLEVLNTGKSPAHNVDIRIIDVEGDYIQYKECNDFISGVGFDLYPDEIVCNQIVIVLGGVLKAVVTLDLTYTDDWENVITERRRVSLFNDNKE